MKRFSLVVMFLLAVVSTASAQSFDQMNSGKQRREYVERYLSQNNLVCPPSGKTKDEEAEELTRHWWVTVSSYLWAACVHQTTASKVSKPAEVAHAEVPRQPEKIQSADSKPVIPEPADSAETFEWPDPPAQNIVESRWPPSDWTFYR